MKRRISMTIDSDLYEWLEMISKREGRTLSNLVSWIIRKAFKRYYKEANE